MSTPELVLEVFRSAWNKREGGEDGGNKGRNALGITDEALIASKVVIEAFLEEVVHRAAAAAIDDGEETISVMHLERVLPQCLLDYREM